MICTICLKEIDIQKSVLTPCNHYFCSHCFFRWIYRAKTCPICRRILIAEANSEEKEEMAFLTELSQREIQHINHLTEEREEKQQQISELYTEIEFLSTIKNQKEKEIHNILERQQQQCRPTRSGLRGRPPPQSGPRGRPPTRSGPRGRRRMGMMWA